MEYQLDCDTCDYVHVVEEEGDTYLHAKDHEEDHPSHFVIITTVQ